MKVECVITGTELVSEKMRVDLLRVDLAAAVIADERVVGLKVLIVVLWEELASSLLDFLEDRLLVYNTFFTEL